MVKYIIPEVIAFQLANSYSRGCLCEATFEQHYNSMRDVFNIFPSLDEVKNSILELLKIKYNLQMKNENPTVLEKWQ